MAEVRYRINDTTRGLMLGTAIFFDVLELMLDWAAIGGMINPILTAVFGGTFWMWFSVHKVSWVNPKNAKRGVIVLILEIVPFLDPIAYGWTIGAYLMIRASRKEDVAAGKTQESMGRFGRTETLKEGGRTIGTRGVPVKPK